MFAGKPIIGLAGGIGSGKSYVARLFGELGCRVIDSDNAARAAYELEAVRTQLREWWGSEVFLADGRIDRPAVARKIFSAAVERQKLESLIHPFVAQARRREMESGGSDASVLAFAWDTPLLFEAGLSGECDAIVFVKSSREVRLQRLIESRGSNEEELVRREKNQWPLDKKLAFSDYVIDNTARTGDVRGQVREILSQILAKKQIN